jgi:hypothetical protein
MANTNSIDLELSSDQWLRADDSASLSITGAITLQAWIKRESTGAVQTILSKWNTTGNQRSYELRFMADDTIQVRLSDDGTASTSAATSDTIVDTSAFHHVAVSINVPAGTYQFVIDGSNSQSGSGLSTSIFNSTAKLGIGGEDQGTDTPVNPFDGLLDEPRIYNTNRSTASIAGDYLQEITDMTNVAGYWKLNNTLTDESGNANTLTNLNSAVFSTTVPFGGATAPRNFRTLLGVGS